MKSAILFVAASVMLVGAMIAIALPNAVEAQKAAPKSLWCFNVGAAQTCRTADGLFHGKGQCVKVEEQTTGVTQSCHKVTFS